MLSRITSALSSALFRVLVVVLVPVTGSLNGIPAAEASTTATDKRVVSAADAEVDSDADVPSSGDDLPTPPPARGGGQTDVRAPAHRIPGPDDVPEPEAGPATAGRGKLEALLPMMQKLLSQPATRKIFRRMIEEGTQAAQTKGGVLGRRLRWMRHLLAH